MPRYIYYLVNTRFRGRTRNVIEELPTVSRMGFQDSMGGTEDAYSYSAASIPLGTVLSTYVHTYSRRPDGRPESRRREFHGLDLRAHGRAGLRGD
jgi:hypothetical protein